MGFLHNDANVRPTPAETPDAARGFSFFGTPMIARPIIRPCPRRR